MEEKKTLKINVLTISLLLVIIILIGYICIERRDSEKKISSLEKYKSLHFQICIS